MTGVNPDLRVPEGAAESDHVISRMNGLLRSMRAALLEVDPPGLRGSHLRLLTMLGSGCTITELAERLGMTKQAAGQFVTYLSDGGYVEVTRDPHDRRVRLVRPTAAGRAVVRRTNQVIERVERRWAAEVGAERYTVFRETLGELVRSMTAAEPTVSRSSDRRG